MLFAQKEFNVFHKDEKVTLTAEASTLQLMHTPAVLAIVSEKTNKGVIFDLSEKLMQGEDILYWKYIARNFDNLSVTIFND